MVNNGYVPWNIAILTATGGYFHHYFIERVVW